MYKRIDHVALTVRDRQASIRFYEEHFGFLTYAENDVPVPGIEKIVYLKLGDTVLELVHMPAGSATEGFHFCLESDDFDGDYARLIQAGVPLVTAAHPTAAREPREACWRRAVFAGPDGEQVEIRG